MVFHASSTCGFAFAHQTIHFPTHAHIKNKNKKINYRESWAMIGRRGGVNAGMVTEDHGKAQSNSNPACGGGGRP